MSVRGVSGRTSRATTRYRVGTVPRGCRGLVDSLIATFSGVSRAWSRATYRNCGLHRRRARRDKPVEQILASHPLVVGAGEARYRRAIQAMIAIVLRASRGLNGRCWPSRRGRVARCGASPRASELSINCSNVFCLPYRMMRAGGIHLPAECAGHRSFLTRPGCRIVLDTDLREIGTTFARPTGSSRMARRLPGQ